MFSWILNFFGLSLEPKPLPSRPPGAPDVPKIEMYLTQYCPFCVRARALLDSKNVAYDMIDVGAEPKLRGVMMDRANGRHTVPQIFIDDQHIGGCNELVALNRRGGLDPLLNL